MIVVNGGSTARGARRKMGLSLITTRKLKSQWRQKNEDRMEEFKSRLGELAVDKIWMPPMKIWSMVRAEIVTAELMEW